MKCLDEGALEAYLDGELPEDRMRGAAGHMESCADCRARLAAMEATQACVHQWLAALGPESLPALDAVVPRKPAHNTGGRWRWAAVAMAGALAASGVVFIASVRPEKAAAIMQKPQMPPAPYPVATSREPSGRTPLRRVRARRPRAQPELNDFVALDDGDPIQMGMVVRVMLPVSDASFAGTQEVAADLVIGEDGRARAIRFVR